MYFILFLSVLCFYSVGGVQDGDPCTSSSTGQQGTCRTILNCQAARTQLHRTFPQPCGVAGGVAIICCIEGPPPVTTTTTTTQSSTSKTTKRMFTTPKAPSNSSLINPYQPNGPGFKSFEKCLEYSKLVFTYKKPPILIIDKEEIKQNACGFKVVPLIIGGELTGRREFPHMALVGYDGADEGILWLCGGSLISEYFVLTAGHCLRSEEYGNATHVRLGVTDKNDRSHRQDIKVAELIKHPDYWPPALYNDIGLLKLEKKVEFDIYVRPACLHNFKNALGESAIATGWGKTTYDGSQSDKLMKVILDLADQPTCAHSFIKLSKLSLERGIDYDLMVCGGFTGKDTCQGDSGGPLQIYSPIDCMYEIIGVTSFGKKGCGKGKSPGVYTRVSRFVEWLEKMVYE